MPQEKNPVYIATAIAYPNAAPHMGHAMEFIEGDCIARYYRMTGRETYFSIGTDEHGIKQEQTAKKLGITPRELTDQNVPKFQALQESLQLSNDEFIRTADEKRHWPSVVKMWNKLVEAGDIYKDSYEGLYCSGCERFLTEKELVDGKCPIHKTVPERVVEENYFFRLSKYSEKLIELIESKEIEIVPAYRANEILNVMKEGLHDVSFSRSRKSLNWGVPVPNDDEQVMYVWCDALTNYLSVLNYGGDQVLFNKFWPNIVHVIGKDIVRFHAAYFQAMLIAAGLPVSKKIFVHGFVTSEGQKMSKSLGNVVDPSEIVEKYGIDAFRYYLLSEIPVGQDGDFSVSLFEERYNAHLCNNLGNLLNRVVVLTKKYFDGKIPATEKRHEKTLEFFAEYKNEMENLMLHKGAQVTFDLLHYLNKYIDEKKPWTLFKEGKIDEVEECLAVLLESLRFASIMLIPFIPSGAQKMRAQLGLPEIQDFEEVSQWNGVKNWEILGESSILFPRIENE